jgi:hypothetical protein
MLIGKGDCGVAVFARAIMYGMPACFTTLGLIAKMKGDFYSTAASATALRLSRFCTLKAGIA